MKHGVYCERLAILEKQLIEEEKQLLKPEYRHHIKTIKDACSTEMESIFNMATRLSKNGSEEEIAKFKDEILELANLYEEGGYSTETCFNRRMAAVFN